MLYKHRVQTCSSFSLCDTLGCLRALQSPYEQECSQGVALWAWTLGTYKTGQLYTMSTAINNSSKGEVAEVIQNVPFRGLSPWQWQVYLGKLPSQARAVVFQIFMLQRRLETLSPTQYTCSFCLKPSMRTMKEAKTAVLTMKPKTRERSLLYWHCLWYNFTAWPQSMRVLNTSSQRRQDKSS